MNTQPPKHLAEPHPAQHEDYPHPPEGCVLIATSADRLAAGKKRPGDLLWRGNYWVASSSQIPFRESLIYARPMKADK